MYGPIIFSAHSMSPTTTFTVGQYITGFAEFLTNVGDSFTLTDGIFKAPRNGIYEFSVSLYHRDNNANALAAVKNGAQVVKFQDWLGGTNVDFTLTFNWIMKLQKGDNIQLQVAAGVFYCDSGNANCIFNGKII